ncbi:MAG: hypothetical protein FWC47_15120 [Oscillospiraceae bacterium]|nr:hypothetical protein [Oscillospiraceae bacterium]
MINETIKTNAVIVSYDLLSLVDGKSHNKRQILNVMAVEANNEDFFAIGKALGDMLIVAPKEILKNSTSLLVEA